MKYHSLKMEEVNETMRHLWNKTYQGTGGSICHCHWQGRFADSDLDIDGIKIVSEGDAGTGIRKQYNYRVRLPEYPIYIFIYLFSLGRDGQGPGGDGHARSLLRWSENAGIHHHPSCSLGQLRAELRHFGAR